MPKMLSAIKSHVPRGGGGGGGRLFFFSFIKHLIFIIKTDFSSLRTYAAKVNKNNLHSKL